MEETKNITDWQLACGDVKQRNEFILRTGLWSDCAFLVGKDQVLIKGHKLVLAIASPVFEAMFFGSMPEGNDPIIVTDMQPECFTALVKYIYTDIIEIDSFQLARGLYYGAQKYLIPHLLTVCSTYFHSTFMTPQNAGLTYEFAKLMGETEIVEKCLKVIKEETQVILNDNTFEDLDVITVADLFSFDDLNIDNEMDLFDAIERYSKALLKSNCKISAVLDNEEGEKEPDMSSGTETSVHGCLQNSNEKCDSDKDPNANFEEEKSKYEEPNMALRAMLLPALKQIRFLTMDPKEFVECDTLNNFFTEKEILAFIKNILSSNTEVPIPEGFSSSRNRR